jgi:hypothetical protein
MLDNPDRPEMKERPGQAVNSQPRVKTIERYISHGDNVGAYGQKFPIGGAQLVF